MATGRELFFIWLVNQVQRAGRYPICWGPPAVAWRGLHMGEASCRAGPRGMHRTELSSTEAETTVP